MKFEIYLLHRDEVYLKYGNVPDVISFFMRTTRANAYSVMARRGEKAIFIEKITDLSELSKKLTEFMVKTAAVTTTTSQT